MFDDDAHGFCELCGFCEGESGLPATATLFVFREHTVHVLHGYCEPCRDELAELERCGQLIV